MDALLGKLQNPEKFTAKVPKSLDKKDVKECTVEELEEMITTKEAIVKAFTQRINAAKEGLEIKIQVGNEGQRLKSERERVNQGEKEMKQKVKERLAERKRKWADDGKTEDGKIKKQEL